MQDFLNQTSPLFPWLTHLLVLPFFSSLLLSCHSPSSLLFMIILLLHLSFLPFFHLWLPQFSMLLFIILFSFLLLFFLRSRPKLFLSTTSGFVTALLWSCGSFAVSLLFSSSLLSVSSSAPTAPFAYTGEPNLPSVPHARGLPWSLPFSW